MNTQSIPLDAGGPVHQRRDFTVVFRDPTPEQVRQFMDHPQSIYFGWCHAPRERDAARQELDAARLA